MPNFEPNFKVPSWVTVCFSIVNTINELNIKISSININLKSFLIYSLWKLIQKVSFSLLEYLNKNVQNFQTQLQNSQQEKKPNSPPKSFIQSTTRAPPSPLRRSPVPPKTKFGLSDRLDSFSISGTANLTPPQRWAITIVDEIIFLSFVSSRQSSFGGSVLKQSRLGSDVFARPRVPPLRSDPDAMQTDIMDDISPFDSVSNWGDEMDASFESSKSDNKVVFLIF